jgi:hypothetical protein
LFLSVSCSDSKQKKPKSNSIESPKSIEVKEQLNLEKDAPVPLREWVTYYKNKDPSFSLQSFEFAKL